MKQNNMTYEYAGICICGLDHYSRGYTSATDAHDDILKMCIAGVLSTGVMHSFSVTQCVRVREEYEYMVVYHGKVQKTKVEYTLFNNKKQKKVIILNKNDINMKQQNFFTDSEIRFLSLSPEVAKNIASKCAEAVNQNYSNGDSAVRTAVSDASNGLVTVSVANKVGNKKDGYVCLQHWDLYGKTHCTEFLQLPVGSKKYNRINGTIKIENLEKMILEVHAKGNKQLREIQGAGLMKQVSAHVTQGASCNTPVTVTQITNTSATTVDSHTEELEDAIVYVDKLVQLFTAYIRNNDVERGLLDIKDIGSLIKTKSIKLFTATIKDEEIVISALSTGSYKTVTLEAQDDTIYDDLYDAISELLIDMSILKNDVVASTIKLETIVELRHTLQKKSYLGSDRDSPSGKTIEEITHDRVESSEDRQDRNESVCMTLPYSNTLWIPHIHWG